MIITKKSAPVKLIISNNAKKYSKNSIISLEYTG